MHMCVKAQSNPRQGGNNEASTHKQRKKNDNSLLYVPTFVKLIRASSEQPGSTFLGNNLPIRSVRYYLESFKSYFLSPTVWQPASLFGNQANLSSVNNAEEAP